MKIKREITKIPKITLQLKNGFDLLNIIKMPKPNFNRNFLCQSARNGPRKQKLLVSPQNHYSH